MSVQKLDVAGVLSRVTSIFVPTLPTPLHRVRQRVVPGEFFYLLGSRLKSLFRVILLTSLGACPSGVSPPGGSHLLLATLRSGRPVPTHDGSRIRPQPRIQRKDARTTRRKIGVGDSRRKNGWTRQELRMLRVLSAVFYLSAFSRSSANVNGVEVRQRSGGAGGSRQCSMRPRSYVGTSTICELRMLSKHGAVAPEFKEWRAQNIERKYQKMFMDGEWGLISNPCFNTTFPFPLFPSSRICLIHNFSTNFLTSYRSLFFLILH